MLEGREGADDKYFTSSSNLASPVCTKAFAAHLRRQPRQPSPPTQTGQQCPLWIKLTLLRPSGLESSN